MIYSFLFKMVFSINFVNSILCVLYYQFYCIVFPMSCLNYGRCWSIPRCHEVSPLDNK